MPSNQLFFVAILVLTQRQSHSLQLVSDSVRFTLVLIVSFPGLMLCVYKFLLVDYVFVAELLYSLFRCYFLFLKDCFLFFVLRVQTVFFVGKLIHCFSVLSVPLLLDMSNATLVFSECIGHGCFQTAYFLGIKLNLLSEGGCVGFELSLDSVFSLLQLDDSLF